jgi:hypothetical protein
MEQMLDICWGSVGPLERTQGSATRSNYTIVVDNTPLSQYELPKETHREILKPNANIIQHTYLVV